MTIMTMGFVKLTAGVAVELKSSREWSPVWVRASEVVAVGEHFLEQTWAGRTFATVDGAVLRIASMPGEQIHVRETPEQVIEMLAEAGE